MEAVLIIGRVLFAAIFIYSGITHIAKTQALAEYVAYKKVPAAKLVVIVSGLMISVDGLYIACGVYADLGALLIAIFLVPKALKMHAFWKESEATARLNERMHFLKDISLSGAALIIFALVGSGADFGPTITGAFFNF